jgi:cytochrome P450
MTDTTTDPATIDPDALLAEILLTPEGKADPYSRYAAIREHSAAHRTQLGFVAVGRFDDCQWVLRDPRFGKGEIGPIWERHGVTEEEWRERFSAFSGRTSSMLMLDPPDHTRLRRLVAKAFTPKTVEQLRPEIVRLTDGILDRFDGGGVVDVIPELALQLPMAVISEMLGVPESYWPELQPLIRTAVATLELDPPLEALEAAAIAGRAVTARFEGLVDERRAHPSDDLLSELVHVEEEGEQLNHDELMATILLLFGAGFETTTNLIGNGLLALLEHPGELARLRADRTLLGSAVEELLRWDSPVQIDGRSAFEEVEVAGHTVPAGGFVVTLLAAANHDPTHYTAPDRFDVGRDEGPPMSFASGIHFCLGAALARLEGQVVFGRVLERFPTLELLDEDPPHKDNFVLRGLSELRIEARAA